MAEGLKIVSDALDAGASVESLFIAAEGRDSGSVEELARRALDRGVRVFDLGAGIMERVADTVTPQPVCAVVGMPETDLAAALLTGKAEASPAEASARDKPPPGGRADRLAVVCVDVRDPGNLGAIMRSAAGAGGSLVICAAGTADPFNPKTVRASAGTIFRIPVATSESPLAAMALLRRSGFRLLATTARDGVDYAVADLSGDIALVLGNEASGLDPAIVAETDARITIPMALDTESLNVAMTATVLVHEIARRRRAGEALSATS